MDGDAKPPDAAVPTLREAGAKPPLIEAAQNQRQQRKLIRALLEPGVSKAILGMPDVPVTLVEKETFFERVRRGEIGPEQVNGMLSLITTPLGTDSKTPRLDGAGLVLSDLSTNRQGRAVIAHFTRGSIDLRDHLTPQNIADFYRANPLPSDFERIAGANFLKELEALNGSAKTAEYRDSMVRMMRIVYGKRMDYWEQFKLLQKDAEVTQKPKAQKPQHVRGLPNQGNNLNDPNLIGPWKRLDRQ